MTRRLAVVPARAGSKRILNKNVRAFCGRPIIAYVLEAALGSGLFDVIHVSTDSADHRAVVEGLGFDVPFLRPVALADDHTPIMPVLKHVVDEYARRGVVFDEVWLLMACAPLVEAEDLLTAATVFETATEHDALLAVAEYPAPVEWAFTRSVNHRLSPVSPGLFATRSQDLGKKYYDAGAFAAFPTARVTGSQGAGSDAGYLAYVLPGDRVVDIDDEPQWRLAEAMYAHRLRSRTFDDGSVPLSSQARSMAGG